ncbi:MAG: hypothetical protein HOL98_11820 [Gammaproteobacteria bacterium]|jgi:hypothetical protein|nr:hypothetical protein [Gammaproteobacteria bacterium]MBT5204133.1 hypothetical protein [Gammaproteobacteria bacterium]MBT5602636.1 hypothetical protein [Gammaproteobacteria bacterium]
MLRNIAADLFQVSAEQINLACLNLLLQYRNGTLLLSVTPYIALKLLAWDR